MEKLAISVIADDSPSCITNLLAAVCSTIPSDGCIVWRAARSLKQDEPQRNFLLFASWFGKSVKNGARCFPKLRILPYKRSFEGELAGAPEGTTIYKNNFRDDPAWVYSEDPFYDRLNLRHAIALRFRFLRSQRVGVITLYRSGTKRFSEEDAATLGELRDAFPQLYRTARDRAGFRLITDVSKMLRLKQERYRLLTRESCPITRAQAARLTALEQETIADFGELVAREFRGLETSIFLNTVEEPGKYTCHWCTPSSEKVIPRLRSKVYEANVKKQGFSGLVLFKGDPKHIYDTQDPSYDVEKFKIDDPEFTGHSGLGRMHGPRANRLMQINSRLPPPHSLVIATILGGQRSLGFVRCWVANENPKFYTQDDEDLLRMVALDLGRVLVDWRERWIDNKRDEGVRKLTSRSKRRTEDYRVVSPPHSSVDTAIDDVLAEMMPFVDLFVPGADLNSVRLLDKQTQELFFFMMSTKKPPSQKGFERIRFPLSGSSLAALACRDTARKPLLIPDATEKKGYTKVFPGVRHMIVAPIVVDGELEGVIDLRSKSDELLAPIALHLTNVIVFTISALISRARERLMRTKAAEEVIRQEKASREAFEDVAHQMKSPIAEARNRLQGWLSREPFNVSLSDARTMKALLDRAQFTTHLISLFAKITSGTPMLPSRETIDRTAMCEVIQEVRYSAELRLFSDRGIKIACDTEELLKSGPARFRMERSLLVQALTSLVDNAIKYSFRNTSILISTGRSTLDSFFVAVKNKGLLVKSSDVPLMSQRGWRGDEARLTTGEGNGLGLYIVKQIMTIHGGSLDIIPTNDLGYTEARLTFRFEKQI